MVSGVSVAQVARRYAMNANMIHNWLKDPRFAPVTVFLLTGAQLKDEEFRDLLWLINEKAPGTLDENVIEFLESDRKF